MFSSQALVLSEEIRERVNRPESLGGLQGDSADTWNSTVNDRLVRTHFKVERRQVLLEELLMDFYFSKSKPALDTWRDTDFVCALFKHFKNAMPTVDLPGNEFADAKKRERLSEVVTACLKSWGFSLHNKPDPQTLNVPIKDVLFASMTGNVIPWLTLLSGLLSKDVTETMEGDYVDMFRKLMECFSLVVRNGRNARLHLGNTTCNPDLLFASLTPALQPKTQIWLPLEAKSPYWDPELAEVFKEKAKERKAKRERQAKERQATEREAKERQGDTENKNQGDPAPGPSNEPHEDVIQVGSQSEDYLIESDDDSSTLLRSASDSGDHSTSPIPPASPIAGTSTEMSSGDDNHEIPRKKKRVSFSSWSGSTLQSRTRETIKAFFSQLLGSVIALQQENPSEKAIGIGVVGYKIVFLAYYGCDHEERLMKLGDVPKTPGAKTLVQITKPLCILNAKDREEIALALLAIGGSPSYGEL